MKISPPRAACVAALVWALARSRAGAQPWEPDRGPRELVSAFVAEPPKIDGDRSDPAWRAAQPLKVQARKVDDYPAWAKAEVEIKSVWTQTDIYFLVSWPDPTRDASYKPWVWNPKIAAYQEGDDLEDMLALAFPIKGAFSADMLDGADAIWDVWEWKAGRTDPTGFAMDLTHRYSRAKPDGKADLLRDAAGNEFWLSRPEDAGDSVESRRPAPAKFEGERAPQFAPREPSGSAADVRAKGRWLDGRWTVELSRALSTGHADDAPIPPEGAIDMAVAVFDHEERSGHSATAPIHLTLRRESKRAAAAEGAGGIPAWLVGAWELSDPFGAVGGHPEFSAFADGRILLFGTEKGDVETSFRDGALEMDGMTARALRYSDDIVVLLYFDNEEQVFGAASVWSRTSREPREKPSEPDAGPKRPQAEGAAGGGEK